MSEKLVVVDREIGYIWTTPIEVEESVPERALLSGTFLRLNIPTKNGVIYQIENIEETVKKFIGVPVFFGTDERNAHDKSLPKYVGRVVKAFYDKATNSIKGLVEVWKTQYFPDLPLKINRGWGFSIGGKGKRFEYTGTVNKLMKPVVKVYEMIPNHLQLLEPRQPRGDEGATVEKIIPVEESLTWEESVVSTNGLADTDSDTIVENNDNRTVIDLNIKELIKEVINELETQEETKSPKPVKKNKVRETINIIIDDETVTEEDIKYG